MDFPYLGHGVGLRVPHYERALRGALEVDLIEVVSENFFGGGGRPRAVLEAVRRERPLVFHGVALGVGSLGGPDLAYLARLSELARAVEPAWISDHVCWTRCDGRQSHDLLPLPFTEEALGVAVEGVLRAQEQLGRPLVLENVSSYVSFRASHMPEWEFLSELARRSGCGLLLDLNNVVVNAHNHGFAPADYLAGLPRDRVVQLHLANHSTREHYRFDDHRGPVPAEVWALYEAALRRFGRVSSVIEWDEDVPEWEVLAAESRRAAERAEAVLGAGVPRGPEGVSTLELRRPEREPAPSVAACGEARGREGAVPSAASDAAERERAGQAASAHASPGPHEGAVPGPARGGGLERVQRLFFEAVIWPRGVRHFVEAGGSERARAIAATFAGAGSLDAAARLDVYADAYFYRLHDAARELFPRLAFLAGEAPFHDLMTDYLLEHPPRSPDLHHLGDRLPAFIAGHRLGQAQPLLADVAALELALLRALDGPDASQPLTRQDLARVPAERWPACQWSLAPVVQRLEVRHDLEQLAARCAAGDRAGALALARERGPRTLLVSRRGHCVSFRALDPLEASALDQLARGATFGALCEQLAARGVDAAGILALLQRWIDDEVLSA